MARATDDERRRVAAALRRVDAERLDRVYGNDPSHASLMLSFVAEAAGLHYAPYEFTAVELRNHLADLIEPPARCPHYHSDRHYCSVHEDMALIDRDALLALADELEQETGSVCGVCMGKTARRIREACGEA